MNVEHDTATRKCSVNWNQVFTPINCSNIVKEKCNKEKAKMKNLLIKLFSDPETHAPNSSSSLCLGGAVNSVFRT